MWARLRTFHYGEAALWTLFLLFSIAGSSEDNPRAVTLAGIAALAAIGVRATRPEPLESINDPA